MIKTMFGEAVSEFGNCVCIDNGLMLSKEDFEAVKLPKLNEDEQKYYDEVKKAKNGDKREMVSHVNFDVMNLGLDFTYESYYKIIEAIIKGGYNRYH